MAREIECFYFQRYIPEENRGGTYHVEIRVQEDGKIIGPLTPKQADEMGYTLSAIFAELNGRMAVDLDSTQRELVAVRETLGEKVGELEAVKEELRAERLTRVEAVNALKVALSAEAKGDTK